MIKDEGQDFDRIHALDRVMSKIERQMQIAQQVIQSENSAFKEEYVARNESEIK